MSLLELLVVMHVGSTAGLLVVLGVVMTLQRALGPRSSWRAARPEPERWSPSSRSPSGSIPVSLTGG